MVMVMAATLKPVEPSLSSASERLLNDADSVVLNSAAKAEAINERKSVPTAATEAEIEATATERTATLITIGTGAETTTATAGAPSALQLPFSAEVRQPSFRHKHESSTVATLDAIHEVKDYLSKRDALQMPHLKSKEREATFLYDVMQNATSPSESRISSDAENEVLRPCFEIRKELACAGKWLTAVVAPVSGPVPDAFSDGGNAASTLAAVSAGLSPMTTTGDIAEPSAALSPAFRCSLHQIIEAKPMDIAALPNVNFFAGAAFAENKETNTARTPLSSASLCLFQTRAPGAVAAEERTKLTTASVTPLSLDSEKDICAVSAPSAITSRPTSPTPTSTLLTESGVSATICSKTLAANNSEVNCCTSSGRYDDSFMLIEKSQPREVGGAPDKKLVSSDLRTTTPQTPFDALRLVDGSVNQSFQSAEDSCDDLIHAANGDSCTSRGSERCHGHAKAASEADLAAAGPFLSCAAGSQAGQQSNGAEAGSAGAAVAAPTTTARAAVLEAITGRAAQTVASVIEQKNTAIAGDEVQQLFSEKNFNDYNCRDMPHSQRMSQRLLDDLAETNVEEDDVIFKVEKPSSRVPVEDSLSETTDASATQQRNTIYINSRSGGEGDNASDGASSIPAENSRTKTDGARITASSKEIHASQYSRSTKKQSFRILNKDRTTEKERYELSLVPIHCSESKMCEDPVDSQAAQSNQILNRLKNSPMENSTNMGNTQRQCEHFHRKDRCAARKEVEANEIVNDSGKNEWLVMAVNSDEEEICSTRADGTKCTGRALEKKNTEVYLHPAFDQKTGSVENQRGDFAGRERWCEQQGWGEEKTRNYSLPASVDQRRVIAQEQFEGICSRKTMDGIPTMGELKYARSSAEEENQQGRRVSHSKSDSSANDEEGIDLTFPESTSWACTTQWLEEVCEFVETRIRDHHHDVAVAAEHVRASSQKVKNVSRDAGTCNLTVDGKGIEVQEKLQTPEQRQKEMIVDKLVKSCVDREKLYSPDSDRGRQDTEGTTAETERSKQEDGSIVDKAIILDIFSSQMSRTSNYREEKSTGLASPNSSGAPVTLQLPYSARESGQKETSVSVDAHFGSNRSSWLMSRYEAAGKQGSEADRKIVNDKEKLPAHEKQESILCDVAGKENRMQHLLVHANSSRDRIEACAVAEADRRMTHHKLARYTLTSRKRAYTECRPSGKSAANNKRNSFHFNELESQAAADAATARFSEFYECILMKNAGVTNDHGPDVRGVANAKKSICTESTEVTLSDMDCRDICGKRIEGGEVRNRKILPSSNPITARIQSITNTRRAAAPFKPPAAVASPSNTRRSAAPFKPPAAVVSPSHALIPVTGFARAPARARVNATKVFHRFQQTATNKKSDRLFRAPDSTSLRNKIQSSAYTDSSLTDEDERDINLLQDVAGISPGDVVEVKWILSYDSEDGAKAASSEHTESLKSAEKNSLNNKQSDLGEIHYTEGISCSAHKHAVNPTTTGRKKEDQIFQRSEAGHYDARTEEVVWWPAVVTLPRQRILSAESGWRLMHLKYQPFRGLPGENCEVCFVDKHHLKHFGVVQLDEENEKKKRRKRYLPKTSSTIFSNTPSAEENAPVLSFRRVQEVYSGTSSEEDEEANEVVSVEEILQEQARIDREEGTAENPSVEHILLKEFGKLPILTQLEMASGYRQFADQFLTWLQKTVQCRGHKCTITEDDVRHFASTLKQPGSRLSAVL